MLAKDVIKGCNILVESNKGITLEEQYSLQKQPKIVQKDNKVLTYIEIVSVARKVVFSTLGRKNITPRDLKKAIINIIVL